VKGMDHKPGCPHHELAVGWALHCLEPAEEAFLAGHLAGCGDCRRTVRQTEEVGVALALAAPDVEPPAHLEQRLMNAIADTGPSIAPAVSIPPHARPKAPKRAVDRILTVAAAIMLVAVSVGLGVRVAQLDGERDQLAGQTAELSEAMDRVADPDARRTSLVKTDGTPVAMVLANGEQLTVVPVGLPENHVGHQVYVLWGLGNGPPVALDAFDVAADGPAAHTVGLVPQTGAFTAYAVSLEPGQIPPAAPSNVMARGQVTS